MSMIMNHDMTSYMGQRIMKNNSLAMRRSLQKLSTGLRTNIADLDSVAELSISEVMRSRIYGMEKAMNNSQDGISMIQTAIGGLTQTQSMLNRMRELSVQAADDTLTQQDRSYIQVEINEIRDQIDLIGNTTQFNRKSLLSGDTAILWSSTDSGVKAVVKGGLRSIDQYGQKYSVDGNFKLTVETTAGKAQTQKSNVFRVKHDNSAAAKTVNSSLGVDDVESSGEVAPGDYKFSLTGGAAEDTGITFAGSYKIGKATTTVKKLEIDPEDLLSEDFDEPDYLEELDELEKNIDEIFTLESSDGLDVNASILFEVTNVNQDDGTVTLRATANILAQDGTSSRKTLDNIFLQDGSDAVNLTGLFGQNSLSMSLNEDGAYYVERGGSFVVNVSPQNLADDAIGIDIDKVVSRNYDDSTIHYALSGDNLENKEIRFTNFILNEKSGEISEGSLILKTNADFHNFEEIEEGTALASLTINSKGETAGADTSLRDIDKFWDANGNFLLQDPKEITLTQGDGKQAKVMIYADDTLNSLAKKLNDAVAIGLGQEKYVDDSSKFVTYVEGGTKGAEAASGTLVMRSAVAGSRGEISLSGNEDILNAFGMNEIVSSAENSYNVTVRNAHDNSLIAERVEITGNRLVGVIHKNVDVEFDSMLGISTTFDESTQNFSFTKTDAKEVMLHLADNTTVIQSGASEGEDVMINIGDMRSSALGLDGVNVMTRERAQQSIALIDSATDKISMQLATLGASQNRLEHNIGNLTDEMQALIEANSTIRDTDYAKEMIEFTKIRILMESNSAMLAQSNAIQTNSILSLMR